MLIGRFGDTTGAPYVEGRVVFPRLGIHGDVSFLVDTGADTSLLSAMDAIHIGIDFGRITRRSEAQGLGGIIVPTYVEQAIVVFSEPGVAIWAYRGDLEITTPDPDDYITEVPIDTEEARKVPSLLGREILDRWRMVYDPYNESLTFEIHTADLFVDRSKEL